MIWTKRITGWLCLLSLTLSLAFLGYWFYLKASPFFHGAYVRYYDWRGRPDRLLEEVARDGVIDKADGRRLSEYTVDGVRHRDETGWPAVFYYVMDGIPESKHPGFFVLASLQNADRQVVASYPEDLVSQVPVYTGNIDKWKSAFTDFALPLADDASYAELYEVSSPAGRLIGVLGIVTSHQWDVAVIPNRFKASDQTLSTYATLSWGLFILCLLLLPVWVAMDAAWRGMRPFAWGALVLMTSILGLLAYLIARLSPPSPCSNCGELVLAKYKRCPSCGVTLMSGRCPSCRTKLKPGWQYCPVCSSVPSTDAVDAKEASPAVTNGADDELYEDAVDYVALKGSASTGLRVKVTSSLTGAPLADVRVRLQGPSSVDGLTSRDGVFQANKLQSGSYQVNVSKAGYEPYQAGTDVNDGSDAADLKVRLKPVPGNIRGCVTVAGSGEPMQGARVSIDSNRLDRSVVTGASGEYSLDDIPTGPYLIRVDAVGYESQTKVAEVSSSRETRLDFSLGNMSL